MYCPVYFINSFSNLSFSPRHDEREPTATLTVCNDHQYNNLCRQECDSICYSLENFASEKIAWFTRNIYVVVYKTVESYMDWLRN